MKKADDEELVKFFDQITIAQFGTDYRLIDYDTFKEVVDQTLKKGFDSGYKAGVKQAEKLVYDSLQRIDSK